MPSPIAHSAMGYLIYRISSSRQPEDRWRPARSIPRVMLITVSLSLLPDIDAIFGVLAGDFGEFHNNWTHSLVTGVVVSALIGTAVWLVKRSGFLKWFLIALASYELHVIMDFFTRGRGVMLLWPLTADRFSSPVTLFYGLRWSEGLFSLFHLLTLATESVFVLLVWLILQLIEGKRRIQWEQESS